MDSEIAMLPLIREDGTSAIMTRRRRGLVDKLTYRQKLALVLFPVSILTVLWLFQPNSLPGNNTNSHSNARYPIAPQIQYNRTLWGETVSDPFNWFSSTEKRQQLLDYIKEENAYTDSYLTSNEEIKSMQSRFSSKLNGLAEICKDDSAFSDFWILKSHFYAVNAETGRYYRWPLNKDNMQTRSVAKELELYRQGQVKLQLILDSIRQHGNESQSVLVGAIAVSYDERYFAYAVDLVGNERFSVFMKDMTMGRNVVIDNAINDAYYSLQWLDGNRLVYTTVDESSGVATRVWMACVVECEGRERRLVYEEKRPELYVELAASASGEMVFIKSVGQITTHYRALTKDLKLAVLTELAADVFYQVDYFEGIFYILTDLNAPNRRLLTANTLPLDLTQASVLVEESESVYIESFQIIGDFVVLWVWEGGESKLQTVNRLLQTSNFQSFKATQKINIVRPSLTSDTVLPNSFIANKTFLVYYKHSYLTPHSAHELDLLTGHTVDIRSVCRNLTLLLQQYKEERFQYQTYDNRSLPVIILSRVDRVIMPAKTVVNAYGAYGGVNYPSPDLNLLALLDEDILFAQVYVRGDGSLGKQLYEEGKFAVKLNSFLDLRRAVNWLVQTGRSDRNHLALYCRSAGGLMTGTALNWWSLHDDNSRSMPPIVKGKYPEVMEREFKQALNRQLPNNRLFSVIVQRVPFVDVVNDMLDASVPWTAFEWQEWGNPKDNETIYWAMRDYSPYECIPRGIRPPATFVWGGMADSRVPLFEPPKYFAKLRHSVDSMESNRHLLLRMDNYGHFGGDSEEFATIYSFLLFHLK